MILLLEERMDEAQAEALIREISSWGFRASLVRGTERLMVNVVGDESVLAMKPLTALEGVEKVLEVDKPYKLASRDIHPEGTVIRVGEGERAVDIGSDRIAVVAGPCSVETREIMRATAQSILASGASILRAGAFKPRTSPYSFQGLGVQGLRILMEMRDEFGIPFITEVMDTRDVEMVAEAADIIQVGARNAQNFPLLKAVGRTERPVLLKRGIAMTIEEWLMSAEYVMSQGNSRVILCERGIRTFETATRNTLDLNAVPLLKELTHLPVAVDPSHGTGRRELVPPLARASVAAGADMLLVEVHPDPNAATSDGAQTIDLEQFSAMMESLRAIVPAIARQI